MLVAMTSEATGVRVAGRADAGRLAGALAQAFWDDPLVEFLLPDGVASRERRLQTLFTMTMRSPLAKGHVYTAGDGCAAAVWKPPGAWQDTPADLARSLPLGVRALRGRAVRGLSFLLDVEKQHPKDPPHWYLAVLGTEPDSQGKGHGSALLRPILERCDTEGLPAYLESSKERNVPFYERHGFRVTREHDVKKGGPRLWLMWREPRDN